MQLAEKAKFLLKNQIENGFLDTTGFFELVWVNFTRIAFNEEYFKIIENSMEVALKNADRHPDFLAKVNLSMGFLEFLRDNFKKAFEFLDQADNIFKILKDKDGKAASNLSRGFIHRSRGEIDLALQFGLPGREQLITSGKYPMFLIIGDYWIGSIYAENGHLEEALNTFSEGLNVNYPAGIESMGARITNGIASVYMTQKNYPKALEYYEKTMELCEANTENTENTFRSRGLTDLADYYEVMNDLQKAIQYNLQALEIRREMKMQNACITNLVNLGKIYNKQGNYSESISALEEALAIAEAIPVKAKSFGIHQILAGIYNDLGDIPKSYGHYIKFHEVKEEINNENFDQKVKDQIQLFQAEQIKLENELIKAQKKEIEVEKKRSDDLLRNILPEEVAEELKEKGYADAQQYEQVTVLFTDFKNFTGISEKMTPKELVEEIHTCFKTFDEITGRYNLEKIKTIGDSYMCAGGLPITNDTHAVDAVKAGLELAAFIQNHAQQRKAEGKDPFYVRIGIHTGAVVAGIVGIRKFAYDIWGDTVNTASRMESSGEVGKVNISGSTYELVKDHFNCSFRGKVMAKGKGEIDMYFVESGFQ